MHCLPGRVYYNVIECCAYLGIISNRYLGVLHYIESCALEQPTTQRMYVTTAPVSQEMRWSMVKGDICGGCSQVGVSCTLQNGGSTGALWVMIVWWIMALQMCGGNLSMIFFLCK